MRKLVQCFFVFFHTLFTKHVCEISSIFLSVCGADIGYKNEKLSIIQEVVTCFCSHKEIQKLRICFKYKLNPSKFLTCTQFIKELILLLLHLKQNYLQTQK